MFANEFILNRFEVRTTILELIIFLAYILICSAFLKRRFSRLATVIVFAVSGIVIAAVQAAVVLLDGEALMFTLLPLTVYLPFSVLLYFLSDSRLFEFAAVCSVGILGVLILRALKKILLSLVRADSHVGAHISIVIFIIVAVIMLIMAAGLVFVTYRFIGKAFHFCITENRNNRRILSVGGSICLPIIMIFLMMHYYLNSTTDIILLVFSMLIAISVFLIIAKLLIQAAELINARRSEKDLSEYIDLQRRGYDRVVQKIEDARVYRHDMRHHLTVIEGLAKKGDCDKIIDYASNLNGSIVGSENIDYCKNPELNAVLSEYISRAENIGCRIKQSIAFPETLPFEENDICLVLANAIENAINACSGLPEEKRYINISAEYKDGHRLLVSVENPCSDTVEFDENGLPVIEKHSEEHGIGLRSVKRIAEKYNGFLRCKQENGEFVFKTALFYDKGIPEHKENTKSGSISKRAVSSLLGLGLGCIIMLNVFPSAAEAASSLLSINIKTIRNFKLGWGDNSVSIKTPEFTGSGSDELNSAVKNYTDEAKEKFLWYFSRRYNSYVAEDMKYTVIRDDEKYFIAQFNVTINAGGSMDYGRWIVYDKSSGKVLTLSDLFEEGSDYIEIISAEILEQMKYRNEYENGRFFVDGEDAFTKINEDANFYIDSFDRVIIVFDEYEVAPGSMGSPKFIISKKAIQDIEK